MTNRVGLTNRVSKRIQKVPKISALCFMIQHSSDEKNQRSQNSVRGIHFKQKATKTIIMCLKYFVFLLDCSSHQSSVLPLM